MSYYVESDGDRTPKDVYVCESDGSRILTMECASEDRRFRLARKIVALLNGPEASRKDERHFKLVCTSTNPRHTRWRAWMGGHAGRRGGGRSGWKRCGETTKRERTDL